jgi:hypothetical protein
MREATDAILRDARFASAALRIVFDPIEIPRVNGEGHDEYVAGGVADNVPFDIAQSVAAYIDIIAVNPPRDSSAELHPAGALEIVTGLFGVVQERISLLATRLAFSEGLAMKSGVAPASFNYGGYELTISRIRPGAPLRGKSGDFTDRSALGAMFAIGRRDGICGWELLSPGAVFD